MAELHIYAEFARWCPACEEWMGWRGCQAYNDYYTPKFVHANCEAPFNVRVPTTLVVPRIAIHYKRRVISTMTLPLSIQTGAVWR